MSGAIAVIGGTGAEGRGLALRWAASGRRVLIGSRDVAKAEAVAAELTGLLASAVSSGATPDRSDGFVGHHGAVLSRNSALITGHANEEAASLADIVVLAVPYSAQHDALELLRPALAGKTLVTCVVPLKPPKVSVVWHPDAGSAAAEAQAQLGDQTTVVAAFHHVAAGKLAHLGQDVDCDVLVCGDNADAKALAMDLAEAAGLNAIDVGPLANAGVVEGLTSLLIGVNRRYGVRGAGLRLTGMDEPRPAPNAPSPQP